MHKKIKIEKKQIWTKNDLYIDKLYKIRESLDKVIEEVKNLQDKQRFDQIQNLIGHLERLL